MVAYRVRPPGPAGERLAAVNARIVGSVASTSVHVEFGLFEDFEADLATDWRF